MFIARHPREHLQTIQTANIDYERHTLIYV